MTRNVIAFSAILLILVVAEQFDISVEQFHILRHIGQGQGSVSELAEIRKISRAAISQAVEGLVTKGMITRARDDRDRRNIRLTLTTSGSALLQTIFKETSHWMRQFFTQLKDDELRQLIDAMQSLRKLQNS